jgi:hypothetical protein
MKQHRPEVADVIRTHQHDFLARWSHVLSREQKQALRALRDCRTAALGGHRYQCDRCEHRVLLYNSCRNRHCPKCRATARAKWLAERQAELLPVPYFHVVFTLPQQIGRLALQNPRRIYTILFQAASETLLTLPPTPNTSAPPSASSLSCTPGVRTCISIRTCTASCRAEESHPMAPAGSPVVNLSFFLCACSAACSEKSFCASWEPLSAKENSATLIRPRFALSASKPLASNGSCTPSLHSEDPSAH